VGRRRNIRSLLVGAVVLTGLGFVSLELFVSSRFQGIIERRESETSLKAARQAFLRFWADYRRSLSDEAHALGESPLLVYGINREKVTKPVPDLILDRLVARSRSRLVLIADSDGRVVSSSSRRLRASVRQLTGVRYAGVGRAFEQIFQDGERLYLLSVVPIRPASTANLEPLGLIGLGVPLDDAFAHEIGRVSGREALIVNGDQVFTSSGSAPIDRTMTPEERSALLAKLETPVGQGRQLSLDYGGEPFEGLAFPLHRGGGIVVLMRSRVAAGVERVVSLCVFLGCAFVMCVIGFLWTRSYAGQIEASVEKLIHGAEELGDGNIAVNVRLDQTHENEMTDLANAFNSMVTRIGRRVWVAREQAARAAQASRAKDQFLALVGHELRTPLTSIRSFAEILLTFDGSKEEQDEFLAIMRDQSIRLSRLFNDILDLTAMESGNLDWRLSTFSFSQVIRESSQQVRTGAFDDDDVSVLTELPDEDVSYIGDQHRIQQALNELIENACKFSPSGGEVLVVLEAQPGGVLVEVLDHGPGIQSPTERELVFEKFHQSCDGITDKPEGLGLGLALARQIVEIHGGWVSYSNREGGGARFSIFFPDPARQARPIDRLAHAELAL